LPVPVSRRRLTIALALLALLGVGGILLLGGDGEGRVTDAHPVVSWAPPGKKPISDAKAAALVTSAPESVPGNAAANRYVPTRGQLAGFRSARTANGQSTLAYNPLTRYVTGHPAGLRSPSTDELIQWVSHKWGIPTDLLRAQIVVESKWRQAFRGDRESVPTQWYGRYPRHARIAGGSEVYKSLGLPQVKWTPDGEIGAGTEPLRWRSTAFSLDYFAATVRYYYDGLCAWCGPGYTAGQPWNSAGAWFSPEPWANERTRTYVRELQQVLRNRGWPRLGH
jgi:hypothetical protein